MKVFFSCLILIQLAPGFTWAMGLEALRPSTNIEDDREGQWSKSEVAALKNDFDYLVDLGKQVKHNSAFYCPSLRRHVDDFQAISLMLQHTGGNGAAYPGVLNYAREIHDDLVKVPPTSETHACQMYRGNIMARLEDLFKTYNLVAFAPPPMYPQKPLPIPRSKPVPQGPPTLELPLSPPLPNWYPQPNRPPVSTGEPSEVPIGIVGATQ